MGDCTLPMIVSAMTGALALLAVLIVTTLLLIAFSDPYTVNVSTSTDGRRVQLHEQRHEGETGQLHDLAATPLRRSSDLCSSARGDGSRSSTHRPHPGEVTRGRVVRSVFTKP